MDFDYFLTSNSIQVKQPLLLLTRPQPELENLAGPVGQVRLGTVPYAMVHENYRTGFSLKLALADNVLVPSITLSVYLAQVRTWQHQSWTHFAGCVVREIKGLNVESQRAYFNGESSTA